MSETTRALWPIIEALLFSSIQVLSLDRLAQLLSREEDQVTKVQVIEALELLKAHYTERGVELVEVASGFQFRVNLAMRPWLQQLWAQKPARYSKALLETLAIIAYRQPVTRAEIEDIRGVAVSTMMVRTLMEREWIRVVGYKEVPGRPAMYVTTKTFLDYFQLKALDELPALDALESFDHFSRYLSLEDEPGLLDDAEGISALEVDEGLDEPMLKTSVDGVGEADD